MPIKPSTERAKPINTSKKRKINNRQCPEEMTALKQFENVLGETQLSEFKKKLLVPHQAVADLKTLSPEDRNEYSLCLTWRNLKLAADAAEVAMNLGGSLEISANETSSAESELSTDSDYLESKHKSAGKRLKPLAKRKISVKRTTKVVGRCNTQNNDCASTCILFDSDVTII